MQPGFLEFFAGIGLVHMGLKAYGWRCVYANDISGKKKEMYLHEMPDAATYYHCEDIWKTDTIVESIKEQALLATASFPCIDLSLAGHMKGMKGEHSSSFYGFVKVMQRLKDEGRMPPFVMLENVTGLLTSNDGKDFKEVCTTISNLGFFLDAFVIDAKHFAPQSRPRLFIVGMLENVLPSTVVRDSSNAWRSRLLDRASLSTPRLTAAIQSLELPTGWVAFDLPLLPSEQRNLASVIDLDDKQEWWGDEAVHKHLEMMTNLHRERVERMRASGRLWIGTIFRRIRHGRTRAETRFDGLAGCLRTAKGGSAKQIVIVVDQGGVKMRWMSPVEYARLQGVPDYKIRVSRNQAITGFADAVCVPVIEWIDRHIFSPAAARLGFEMHLQETSAATLAELSVIYSR
jgi:DNA (cytosine-5)-methyltransferase 1